MRLETKDSWKSKNLGTFKPRLMMGMGLATLASLNAGCSSSAQPKAPAPPEVRVAEVICKQIGDSDEFTGRLEAVNAVEVRPRVSGYLQSGHFKEGEIVRQGDLLFRNEPRPFQQQLDPLKGGVTQAKSRRTSRMRAPRNPTERVRTNCTVQRYWVWRTKTDSPTSGK